MVREDSKATPYYYSRYDYPRKTYRQSYFDLAHSAIVTKKFGQVKPFWVKGLDYASKGVKWYWRNRRWLKYYKAPWWYPYNAKIQKTYYKLPKKGYTKLQTSKIRSTCFRCSRNSKRSYDCYRCRQLHRSKRSKQRSTNWRYYKSNRYPVYRR